MEEYRKRCYESFVSKHWAYTHSMSKEEYELYYRICLKRFKNVLPDNKAAKIIDVACGSGHFLYFLQKAGYKNTKGIDLSAEQLAVANKMGVQNLEQVDLFEYLAKHPATFDVIIANDIIEHFYKDEILKFLDALYAALKPGGMVVIATLNASSLFGANGMYIDFTHEVGFTPESFMHVMRVCNFEDVKTYGESPVVYDLRSGIRASLWWLMQKVVKAYLDIERGRGRNLWKRIDIFESRMFAVGRKK
ncbi:MAG: class I SAM-dependent methyltransferase [Candidatus Omnitrophica bacterium]|nr:class I SAM-dependent methyltransferase [Candidatus Omnitrophota bacterium]